MIDSVYNYKFEGNFHNFALILHFLSKNLLSDASYSIIIHGGNTNFAIFASDRDGTA